MWHCYNELATTVQDWNYVHLAPSSYVTHSCHNIYHNWSLSKKLLSSWTCFCRTLFLSGDIGYCAVASTVSDIKTLVQGHLLWIAEKEEICLFSNSTALRVPFADNSPQTENRVRCNFLLTAFDLGVSPGMWLPASNLSWSVITRQALRQNWNSEHSHWTGSIIHWVLLSIIEYYSQWTGTEY